MGGNPFDYQNPTHPEHFLDREADRDRLRRHLGEGVNVLVYGPRRRGKTSLIASVFDSLEHPTIYADATRMRHPGDLGDLVLRGLAASGITKAKRFQKHATDLVRGLEIEAGVAGGGAYVRLRRGTEPTTGLVQALEFLERAAESAGDRVVVCIDEFQVAMQHEGVVDAVRSVVQHQQHVQYVFSGSEPTVLAAMNQDTASPFYRQLLEFRVRGLSMHDLREDAQRLLGFGISDEAAGRIHEVLGDDTKGTVHVLRHLWEAGDGGPDTAEHAIDAAVGDMSDSYETRMAQVRSLDHKRVLLALAQDGTEHPTASGFIQKHGLKSAAHVGRALDALKRNKILDEDNGFGDGLFRHFLRQ